MLNVYTKYDKPEELSLYNEKYEYVEALEEFNTYGSLTDERKHILSQHLNSLKKNPQGAVNWAMQVIQGRWADAEPIYYEKPRTSC